jgi:hypothetical protein
MNTIETVEAIAVMASWVDGQLIEYKLKDGIDAPVYDGMKMEHTEWTRQSKPDAKMVWNWKFYDYRVANMTRQMDCAEASAMLSEFMGEDVEVGCI